MTASDLKLMESELNKLQKNAVEITATAMDLFTSLRILTEEMERNGWHRQGDTYNPAYTRAINSLEAVRNKGNKNEHKR